MRTEKATLSLVADKKDTPDRVNVKGVRRTLGPLQKAAGDKENLVGGGRNTKQMLQSKVAEKKTVITEEDLTSEDGPSEGYWKILAERRRVALDATLAENKKLHERISLLEEENAECKRMLDETTLLVETLTEVLNEKEPEEEESNEEEIESDKEENKSDNEE